VWAWEEGFDCEGLRGGVCLGDGVALGLGWLDRSPCMWLTRTCSSIKMSSERLQEHTSVVNAVFPPPLGPTSRKVGSVAVAAAFLYRKLCSSTGSPRATINVMMMVVRFGEKAAVSQLSSSYHAMAARQWLSCTQMKPECAKDAADIVSKQRIDATCIFGQGTRRGLFGA